MIATMALATHRGVTIEAPPKPWKVGAMHRTAVVGYMLQGTRGNELAQQRLLQHRVKLTQGDQPVPSSLRTLQKAGGELVWRSGSWVSCCC